MNNPFRFEPETFYMPSESEEAFETFNTEYSAYNFEEETRRPHYRAQASRSSRPRSSGARRMGLRSQSSRPTSQLRKRQMDRRFPRPRFPSGVSFPTVFAPPYLPVPPQPPASPTNQQPTNGGGGSAPFPSDSGQSAPQGSEFIRWVQSTLN